MAHWRRVVSFFVLVLARAEERGFSVIQAHLAALRSRLDVLVPLARDLARDAPGPEGGEKSVALDVVRELDAWTRARLVEGLRALSL